MVFSLSGMISAMGIWLFIPLLLLIAWIDLKQQRIPNKLVFPGALLALLAHALNGRSMLLSSLLGAVVGGALFLLLFWLGQRLFGPGALGWGDVKLAIFLGALVGVLDVLWVLALGMLLGGLAALFLLATGRRRRTDYLPYGAFLALAAVFWNLLSLPIFGVQ